MIFRRKIKIYAVLLAAGTGSRTGFSLPKQLIKIKNKEIILHSLDIFLNSKINFDAIIITVPPPQIYDFKWNAFFGNNLSEEKNKKIKIITGGKSRQESVYNAIKYIENRYIKANASEENSENAVENAVVFIHDSARPFVTDNELSMLLDKTAEYGAAFLCSGVTETIKEINAGKDKIAETAAHKTDAVKLNTLLRAYSSFGTDAGSFRYNKSDAADGSCPQMRRMKIAYDAVNRGIHTHGRHNYSVFNLYSAYFNRFKKHPHNNPLPLFNYFI